MMKGHAKDDVSAKSRERATVPAARTNAPRAPAPIAERYPWDPYAVTAEFDRYFDLMRRNMENLVVPAWSTLAPRARPMFGEVALPRADLRDEGEAYVAAFELPGYAREDLDIEVTPERLEVFAKHEGGEEREAKDEDFLARERSYREMRRTFEFPDAVLPEKVSAELKDGVLTVRAPKVKPTAHEPRVRVKIA